MEHSVLFIDGTASSNEESGTLASNTDDLFEQHWRRKRQASFVIQVSCTSLAQHESNGVLQELQMCASPRATWCSCGHVHGPFCFV